MADFIQDLADGLARDVLAGQKELKDDYFYEQVSKVVGASSPTLQEAFMTSIRIRLAERRAVTGRTRAAGQRDVLRTALRTHERG